MKQQILQVMNKEQMAIERIKSFEPPEGYFLAFSGGKDSIVLYDLTMKAKVKFDAHYSLTTIDPPELVQFIKNEYPAVIIDKPKISFWRLMEKNLFPPLRHQRYCCKILKERGGEGRKTLLGLRWEESFNRSKRQMVSYCEKKDKHSISPIIDWTTADVWDYIRQNNLNYCNLYDRGYNRLGCIFCPNKIAKEKQMDLQNFPTFAKTAIKTLDKIIQMRKEKGLEVSYKTGEDFFYWWNLMKICMNR